MELVAGLPLAFVLATIVACDGMTSGIRGDAGVDGGGGQCTQTEIGGTRSCVPGTAKAGTAISIEAEGGGCLGCGTSMNPCKVQVSGTEILLTLATTSCPLPPGTACPAVCGVPKSTCAIPPLAAGTYTVNFTSSVHGSEAKGRRLVVDSSAATTSCTLPAVPESKAMRASDYPQACAGDAECALVTEGSVCQVCACPNAAVAKTSLPAYESEQRAAESSCAGTGTVACGPCQSQVAKCTASKCVAAPQ